MKRYAILATLVAFAGFAPALHAETPSPVMVKLTQIDLDVAIHHYEKLQGLLRDTELERMIGDGTRSQNHPDQDRLERKISILQKLCADTREEILKLGEVVETSRATSGVPTNPEPVAPPPLQRSSAMPGAASNPSVAPAAGSPGQFSVPGAAAPPSAMPAAPAVGAPRQFALPQPQLQPPAGVPGIPEASAPLAPPLPAPEGF
ncbi:hypothetical protein [Luteolibacter sp. Populi]|uniref:hypothetical protein n=1 Tax=Luteolibacter sp. Populi TaxID=3230487 RepID=UPI0034677102